MRPPEGVRGMRHFDPEAFRKAVQVPVATVLARNVGAFRKLFNKYVLKMPNLPFVLNVDEDGQNEEEVKEVLLNPDLFVGEEVLTEEDKYVLVQMTYEHIVNVTLFLVQVDVTQTRPCWSEAALVSFEDALPQSHQLAC